MHIVSAYAAAIFVASTLAALFNSLLIYLYYRCPLKHIRGYKYFFLLTAVQDLLASICIHLTAPRIAAQNSYLVYVATGPIYFGPYADYIMLLFFLMMSSSILILTNSFAYRYVQLCLPKFSYIYDSWRWITTMIAANLFIFLNFLFVVGVTTMPDDTFKKQVYDEDLFELGSFTNKSFVGLSMKYSVNGLTIPALADCVTIVSFISILGVFFATSIQRKLKEASLSERTRRLQKQLFQMLLLQTICPTIFLYLPSTFAIIVYFGFTKPSSVIYDWCGLSFAHYSIFNPLLMIFFVKDYRNYIISFPRRTVSMLFPSKSVSTNGRYGAATVATDPRRYSTSNHL